MKKSARNSAVIADTTRPGSSRLLEAVNPRKVKDWSRWGYVGTGTSGILLAIRYLQHLVPESLLGRFPNYETYFWAALALAFLPTMFLKAVPKIIFLSIAELGVIASFFYIAYSLTGIFIGELLLVFVTYVIILFIGMIIVFSEGLKYSPYPVRAGRAPLI